LAAATTFGADLHAGDAQDRRAVGEVARPLGEPLGFFPVVADVGRCLCAVVEDDLLHRVAGGRVLGSVVDGGEAVVQDRGDELAHVVPTPSAVAGSGTGDEDGAIAELVGELDELVGGADDQVRVRGLLPVVQSLEPGHR
jgi:hypothetical protein